jgi:putative protease
MEYKQKIMAPAGSFESLSAAIKAGADSVYFGIGYLNMRARGAVNFQIEDLFKISELCRKNKVKTYLTLNTVMYDNDLEKVEEIIKEAKKQNITAIIACDMAVIKLARKYKISVHMSTQTNISNIEAVKFFAKYADAVVLARELSLEQIKSICNTIKKEKIKGASGNLLKIEIFIHGALCVSISGKCYMSLALYNSSANRGACLQACRRGYRVIDLETKNELELDNNYIMSPKDLCTMFQFDKIIDSGVDILKIEGRGRSPDYVYAVVRAYSKALQLVHQKKFNEKTALTLVKDLKKVFNRGFWHGGYYLGKKTGEWAGVYGSQATEEKIFIGTIKKYFPKAKAAELFIETKDLGVGDSVCIIGSTTGCILQKISEIRLDDKKVKKCSKGDLVSIQSNNILRRNDKVYKIEKRNKL